MWKWTWLKSSRESEQGLVKERICQEDVENSLGGSDQGRRRALSDQDVWPFPSTPKAHQELHAHCNLEKMVIGWSIYITPPRLNLHGRDPRSTSVTFGDGSASDHREPTELEPVGCMTSQRGRMHPQGVSGRG